MMCKNWNPQQYIKDPKIGDKIIELKIKNYPPNYLSDDFEFLYRNMNNLIISSIAPLTEMDKKLLNGININHENIKRLYIKDSFKWFYSYHFKKAI